MLATGLRVGWITASPALQTLFANLRFAMGLNQMSVRVLAAFFANDQFSNHVETVRHLYYRKMTVIADALDAQASDYLRYTRPDGGFYLWLKLADGMQATQLWREAAKLGVSLTRGSSFFSEGAGDNHIRLAFSWTPTERLEDGANRIAQACRIVAGGNAR